MFSFILGGPPLTTPPLAGGCLVGILSVFIGPMLVFRAVCLVRVICARGEVVGLLCGCCLVCREAAEPAGRRGSNIARAWKLAGFTRGN